MSNMSYCRFDNTLADLVDCQESLEALFVNGKAIGSREELIAAARLVETCLQIATLVNEEADGTEDDLADLDRAKIEAVLAESESIATEDGE